MILQPLVRIPCALAAASGVHLSLTPPNPPPAEEGRAASIKLEVLLGHHLLPLTVKTICWSTAFAEVAVVLANYAPSLPVSKIILSNLIFADGTAGQIHRSLLSTAGLLGVTLGTWIRYKCYKALGAMFTYQMSIRKSHVLVTSGPYGVVRHPGYTGLLLEVFGVLLFHGAKGSWVREGGAMEVKILRGVAIAYLALVFTASFGIIKRMPEEDEALHHHCGNKWEDWAKRVPYSLIPWVI